MRLEVPVLPLANGAMPMLGFGTWPMKGDECQRAVELALEVGYRHIDTASGYGNQDAVGMAIRSSGVSRRDLFVTSKVGHERLRRDDVVAACRQSIDELRMDYLDLFLVHWPSNEIPMEDTFRGMRKLLDDGLIRNCGVSNFSATRLKKLLALPVPKITINQVEYHPYLNDKELHDFCTGHGIAVTAYSPLALGKVRDDVTLAEIGDAHGKTPSQVTLRWLYQRGIVSIPKASSRGHMEANLSIFDFELAPEEFAAIDNIDRWERLAYPPLVEMAQFDR